MHDSASLPAAAVLAATPAPRRRRPVWFFVLWLFFVSVLALLIAVPVWAIRALQLGPDARAARDAVFAAVADDADFDQQIEFNVGPGTLSLARLAAGCLDLPPEARTALRAARAVQVGVYRSLQLERVEPAGRGATLQRVTEQLAARSWERVVAVVDDGALVGVFVEGEAAGYDPLRVCVVVCDGDQLVVVSARVAPEPLIELAQSKMTHRHR